MKIPRDAARPKIESLTELADEILQLPFQPEEEKVLEAIIDNAMAFRSAVEPRCQPELSTASAADSQRFFLRKLEGAEVLLAYETNFFRQELHKWCPVAPEPPPILEVSLSTRKPRPTKLMKLLVEYGVEDPDDLPESVKGKANSLRRKAANAEAAAAAAAAQSTGSNTLASLSNATALAGSSSGDQAFRHDQTLADDSSAPNARHDGVETGAFRANDSDIAGEQPVLSSNGPQVVIDDSTLSLEERLLSGKEDINLHNDADKAKALEILSRTEAGRTQAEAIWGPEVWRNTVGSLPDQVPRTSTEDDVVMRDDEGKVDQMFKEMTNDDEDEGDKDKNDEKDGQDRDKPAAHDAAEDVEMTDTAKAPAPPEAAVQNGVVPAAAEVVVDPALMAPDDSSKDDNA